MVHCSLCNCVVGSDHQCYQVITPYPRTATERGYEQYEKQIERLKTLLKEWATLHDGIIYLNPQYYVVKGELIKRTHEEIGQNP